MSTLSEEQSRLRTASLIVLAAVAIAVALVYTRVVMVPFVLAIFISYLVSPIVDAMQLRLRMPRGISVFVALFIVLALMTLLGLLITVSTRGLVSSAEIYRERLASLAQSIFSILDRYQIDLGQQPLLEGLKQLPLLSMLRSTAGTVVGLVSNGLLVLIFVIYLLAGRRPNELRKGIYAEIDLKIRRYIVTKVGTSAATGILVGIILALFGLDLALVFGVLAFLLNFIPNVGSIIATLLPVPLAVVQFESLWPIVGIVLLPGGVQMIIGNGIEPKLMGEGLELHPVTILLALVFWGLLWGIVGMLLAAPMTAVLRIVLGRFETTRPVAELLAGHLPEAESARREG
ncbi:MAG: AI-2E family transporter [Acidobacteriota bacterium]